MAELEQERDELRDKNRKLERQNSALAAEMKELQKKFDRLYDDKRCHGRGFAC